MNNSYTDDYKITKKTYFRAKVRNRTCPELISTIDVAEVYPPIENNFVNPSMTQICDDDASLVIFGSTPTGGTTPDYQYQWELSTTSATSGFVTAPWGTVNDKDFALNRAINNDWYHG